MTPFADRSDAGRRLARLLAKDLARCADLVVLALPRGGVPVGYEIAAALGAPLDVFVVRKLGVPGQEELAMGAVASGGVQVLNDDIVAALGISDKVIDEAASREQRELERRERAYRGDRPMADVRDRTVIVVDDGLATGATMRAAIRALRARAAKRIVVAVPTAPQDTCEELRGEVDQLVCLSTPYPFTSVGQWYRDFSQTSDQEVRDLLDRAAKEHPLP